MKLSDNLAKEFFEILPDSIKTFQFGEIGKDGTEKSLNFSIPETTPEGIDRKSFLIDTVAKQLFSEMDYWDAMLKAADFIETNKIK